MARPVQLRLSIRNAVIDSDRVRAPAHTARPITIEPVYDPVAVVNECETPARTKGWFSGSLSRARRYLVGAVDQRLRAIQSTIGRSVRTSEVIRDEIRGLRDELQRVTEGMVNLTEQAEANRASLWRRFDELEIKVRPFITFDDESYAVRLMDGYLMIPRTEPTLAVMVANAGSGGLEPGTRQVLKALIAPGMGVADVGANIGLLTLTCGVSVGPSGRVYAFEPEAGPRSQLSKTVKLNGLHWVDIHPCAVGAASRNQAFHISPIIGHSSLYALPAGEVAASKTVEVAVARLDDMIAPGERLDVVKIDVEGAELDVLEGMSRLLSENPDMAVVAEYGPSHLYRVGIDPKAWLGAFFKAGFEAYVIDEPSGLCRPVRLANLAHVASVNLVFVRPGGAAKASLPISQATHQVNAGAGAEPLRIGWVSPLNRRSAVARFSVDVTDGLIERGHDVCLIGAELSVTPSSLNCPSKARVIHWSQVDMQGLRRDFDVIIVNVGDNFPFHAGIFRIVGQVPRLGIFHDFYLYDLFNGWLADEEKGKPAAWRDALRDETLAVTYGHPAAAFGRQADTEGWTLETLATRTPMTEWVARGCDGAMAHAQFYVDRLAAACPGPLGVAALPVNGRGVPPLTKRDGEVITVLTVGVMNANKRAADIIEAIATAPRLAERVNYHLVGPIELAEADRLQSLAGALGYGGLTIFGPVDEDALTAHLTAADIICCLRCPVLEGASGSAVEAMLAGRPLIVADAGFYAELPSDLVFKIPADINLERLQGQLERLCDNEPLRRLAGMKARRWAEGHFSVAGYLDRLEPLIWATIDAAPILAAGRGIGAAMCELGLDPSDPVASRIGDAIGAIFVRPS